MERISWHEYFLSQAKLISLRSTCTRLSVGAILVRNNRLIASGYNGSVDDSSHCIDEGCLIVDNHCVRTVHAEMNALLQCARFGVATDETTLYVTHFPCLHCTKHLIQAGIKEIFYEHDYRNNDTAIQLLEEANIPVTQVPVERVTVTEHKE
ncbi:MAG TPA: ComE operon protein 2 [Pseudogracilibacillus sp.]|nr:ComE operon protein 2 [Pseudogracilibacillus sp.]